MYSFSLLERSVIYISKSTVVPAYAGFDYALNADGILIIYYNKKLILLIVVKIKIDLFIILYIYIITNKHNVILWRYQLLKYYYKLLYYLKIYFNILKN